MSYSNEAITALAQLAQATGGLHDRLSKESNDARAIAGEMITAANAAKLQTAMKLGELNMLERQQLTKESLIALKGITAARITAGEMESSSLENIEQAIDDGDSLSYLGSANFGDARSVRKDFAEYVDSIEEQIEGQKLSLADIMTKKNFLGKDSSIVTGTVDELTVMRNNLQNALAAVEQTQQFDPDLDKTIITKGKRPRTVLGIFTDTEEDVAKRANKKIDLIDSLIKALEK